MAGTSLGSLFVNLFLETSQFRSDLNKARREFQVFTSALSTIGKALGVSLGTAAIAGLTTELTRLGLQAKRQEETFDRLTESVGVAGQVLAAQLKAASGDIVSTSDIMLAAARGLREGLQPEQLTALMTAARQQAKLAGTDVTTAFNEITTAIANGNTRMLKMYGATLDVDRVVREYAMANGQAAENITSVGRAQAILQAYLAKTEASTKALTSASRSQSEEVERLRNKWQDWKETVSKGLVDAEFAVARWASQFIDDADRVIAKLKEIGQQAGQELPAQLEALGRIWRATFATVGEQLQPVSSVFETLLGKFTVVKSTVREISVVFAALGVGIAAGVQALAGPLAFISSIIEDLSTKWFPSYSKAAREAAAATANAREKTAEAVQGLQDLWKPAEKAGEALDKTGKSLKETGDQAAVGANKLGDLKNQFRELPDYLSKFNAVLAQTAIGTHGFVVSLLNIRQATLGAEAAQARASGDLDAYTRLLDEQRRVSDALTQAEINRAEATAAAARAAVTAKTSPWAADVKGQAAELARIQTELNQTIALAQAQGLQRAQALSREGMPEFDDVEVKQLQASIEALESVWGGFIAGESKARDEWALTGDTLKLLQDILKNTEERYLSVQANVNATAEDVALATKHVADARRALDDFSASMAVAAAAEAEQESGITAVSAGFEGFIEALAAIRDRAEITGDEIGAMQEEVNLLRQRLVDAKGNVQATADAIALFTRYLTDATARLQRMNDEINESKKLQGIITDATEPLAEFGRRMQAAAATGEAFHKTQERVDALTEALRRLASLPGGIPPALRDWANALRQQLDVDRVVAAWERVAAATNIALAANAAFGEGIDVVAVRMAQLREEMMAMIIAGQMNTEAFRLMKEEYAKLSMIENAIKAFKVFGQVLGSELGNAIVEVKNGTKTIEQAFQDMLNNIADALIKWATEMLVQEAIKAAIRLISQIVMSYYGGGYGGGSYGTYGQAAQGFGTAQHGAIVKARPGGRLMLVGEGGQDEAIVPLDRIGQMVHAGGESDMVVNIYNQTGTPIASDTQQMTGPGGQKMLNVFLRQQVASMVGDGSLDKALGASYGLRRRGIAR
jgi:hypothetical protein